MKIITIGTHSIELDTGEELTMRNMRKIYPIVKENSGNEIETVVLVVKALSNQENIEEIIDSMTVEEFTALSTEITTLLEKKK